MQWVIKIISINAIFKPLSHNIYRSSAVLGVGANNTSMSGRGKGGKWTPYTFPHVWPSRSPDVERTHQAKVTVPWKEWPTRLLVDHDIQGGLSGSLPIDRFGSSKSATCPTSGRRRRLGCDLLLGSCSGCDNMLSFT